MVNVTARAFSVGVLNAEDEGDKFRVLEQPGLFKKEPAGVLFLYKMGVCVCKKF